MKNRIRLTESDLHSIIRESVRRILNERVHNIRPDEINDEDFFDDFKGFDSRDDYKKMTDYDPKLSIRGDMYDFGTRIGNQNGELLSYCNYFDRQNPNRETSREYDSENDWDSLKPTGGRFNEKFPNYKNSETYDANEPYYFISKRSQLNPGDFRDEIGDTFREKFVNGTLPSDLEKDIDNNVGIKQRKHPLSKKQWMKARKDAMNNRKPITKADNTPLHRKGSLNRELD